MKCKICNKEITNEYFEGVNGAVCADCLKRMMTYYALKKFDLIKNIKGD